MATAAAPPPAPLDLPPQARWVRFLNGLGRALDRLGMAPPRLDADRLVARAERATGLHD